MPTQTVRELLAREPRRRTGRTSWSGSTAARPPRRRIGQVHQGRWNDGREVAVKVQYPGAGDALLSDLRQLARLGPDRRRRWCPGIDIKPLIEELQARAGRGARLRARGRGAARVRRGVPRRPRHRRPRRGRASATPCWSPSGWRARPRWPRSSATGTQEERDHYGELFVRFLVRRPGPHRHAARRPAPRQLPDPARPRTAARAGSACSTSAPSPGCRERRLPRGDRPADPDRRHRGPRGAARRAARRGLHQGPDPDRPRPAARLPLAVRRADPGRAVPVHPGVDARAVPADQQPARARRTRSRCKLNLPPSYLLIHRTWLGGIGRALPARGRGAVPRDPEEYLPGFAEV